MAFEHYIRSGQKMLRCGYTTGTCAALAAAGAARLLLTGQAPSCLSLRTPKGWVVEVAPVFCRLLEEGGALCAVRKDGGDDADVTHGMLVQAAVVLTPGPGVSIQGGEGVGRVTRPGLDQPVGAAAINRVPRQMIARAVAQELETAAWPGGAGVTISIPGGAETARRTFNPLLGVEGGLSVLGTSGIVEPMSQQAIVDTIEVEARQARQSGARLILTPGNYGADFLAAQGLDGLGVPVVRCSNFIGDALDIAAAQRFEQVLLAGHIGKLVKVAGGIMNTHSRQADCRTELFCAHAAAAGASTALCRRLLDAATTDACIPLLDAEGLRDPVLSSLTAAVQTHLERRAAGAFAVGALLFSNQYGLLGLSPQARTLIDQWRHTHA
ncbi:cobalt-precorrin-5B (C(1))-methyltransferase CbiD [Faecalibacterium sp. An121]|uniref:cobalt-precorrin-5B (C(1))-methyltransferase CbiD n=1 Tax=Faecalibacterium sp. An121 TaxID=1965550 RepID=UPI000B369E15|nr:cobalt-precorrin-5B (C(1))-methyltransferase CbiD [Faecalibacterium sp. An121]OUQ38890.1 cobalamin biosynthesis protein CbiD [Faecalibacterium sp. An121]